MRKVGSAFLTHREVSAQEAVYRLLSMPMKQLSRSVMSVDTNPKNERIAVLKNNDSLSQLNDDEQADLLGGYPSYEAHYRYCVYQSVKVHYREDVDSIDVDENGPPEHLWDNIN